MTEELRNKVNKWFEKNYEYYLNEVRTNITKGKMAMFSEDLAVFMYMEFMKQKPEKVEQMYNDGKIMNWMLRGASFQIKSSSSPFYTKYRKKGAKNVPEYFADLGYDSQAIELDDYYQCAMEVYHSNKLDFYQREIINLKFIKQKTYNEMVSEYGFTSVSLKRHLNEALGIIRDYCNQKLEE